MSNSGKATLENSIKGDIDLELIGGTEQLTTTGKNIFDESKAVTGRINPDNGELLPEISYISSDYIEVQDETYFQSGSGDGYYRAFYDMNKKFTSIPTKGVFKITVPVGSKFLRISGRKERFGDWMIEKGDKATDYEPYSGGKPSPSPEYPQEIKSAGKWNKEKQKHEIDVKVTGKNLFNLTDNYIWGWFAGYQTQISLYSVNAVVYMPCRPNTTYTIYGRTNVNGNNNVKNRVATANDFPAGGTKLHNITETQLSNPVTITTDELSKYLVIMAVTDNECNINTREQVLKQNVSKMMVIIGNTPTPYEPYTEQTLTLTSDRPLTKWDRLVEQGGQYGWLYKHRIVNDLSALVKDSEPIYGKDGEKYFSVSLQGALFNYDYNKIYSVAGLCPKDSKIHYVPKPMIQSVVIYVSDTDTIMTAKEHMHYKVIYETTESQFAPLSESEQTQLRNLHSYNGTTHINIDSGEVECGIKVAYKQKK